MDTVDWSKIKHFTQNEFCCKCGCGKCDVHPQLVAALDLARSKAGVAFKINSGFRCYTHNKNVGAKPSSSHTLGLAVDIAYANGMQGLAILKALTPLFDRIGVGKNFIHVDIDPDKPSPVLWTY
jgi:zinc D-Ala-D-Ala carboxypeptidase